MEGRRPVCMVLRMVLCMVLCAVLCCALCCAVRCCAVLCCAVWCCVVLWAVILTFILSPSLNTDSHPLPLSLATSRLHKAIIKLPGSVIAESVKNSRTTDKPAPNFLHLDKVSTV